MAWTLEGTIEHEAERIRGSRFVADAAPVSTAEDAMAFVRTVSARRVGANHHCFAYRLATGDVRASDDGEPSGSAGRPMLARLEGRDAVDVVVVVTRWFGGTRLGVGGLVRAYGGTAGAALDAGVWRERVPLCDAVLTHTYADTASIAAVLAAARVSPGTTDYGHQVCVYLRLAEADMPALRARLQESTSGRATLDLRP